VRCFAGFALVAIDDAGVDIESLGDGGRVRLPGDLVVLVTGYEPVAGLADELRAAGLPTTVIGDAATPGRLRDATSSALRAVLDHRCADRPHHLVRRPVFEGELEP